MISLPGIHGGVYCNEPAISWDILPTMIDFAVPGFALPKGVEGGSLKAVLLNSGVEKIVRPIDRFVFHQQTDIDHPQSAMRKGDYKLIYQWDTHESQLFNLAQDLSEKLNLAKEKPEQVELMRKELIEHVRVGLGEEACTALENGVAMPHRKGDK